MAFWRVRRLYRGFFASRLLDWPSLLELFEYRLMVEPMTSSLAARRCHEEGVSALEALCDPVAVAELSTGPGAAAALAQRDAEFHLAVATAAGNNVVLESLRPVMARVQVYNSCGLPGAIADTWNEHAAVADAIRANDPDRARHSMRHHLLRGLERIKKVAG